MDHPSICNATILTIEDHVGNSWISPISDYLRNGTLPMDKSEAESKGSSNQVHLDKQYSVQAIIFWSIPKACPT